MLGQLSVLLPTSRPRPLRRGFRGAVARVKSRRAGGMTGNRATTTAPSAHEPHDSQKETGMSPDKAAFLDTVERDHGKRLRKSCEDVLDCLPPDKPFNAFYVLAQAELRLQEG